ncbi:MAG TPA: tetratricopeptide repeat protein [Dehalococcoidia bacterium]|nr:tetratricopeptide repeat protein [Dehalococcoidia bacterium]
MEELIGRTLGRYEVTALVGRGGMATVYKARHPGLNRNVAVKVLHRHLAVDPAFVGRFRREARAVAALRHPNIVRVYDFDSEGDLYFIVMEFIDGPTFASFLKRLFKQGRHLSAAEILRLFSPLCSAIHYAHEQGMVHRDIKPSNVILTRKHEPILTDYGIARIAGATAYTIPGVVIGSAHYMSPEQAEGLPGDNRSDIYSLGIVLFEALTGAVPFQGETPASVLMKQVASAPPPALSLNPDLPPAIEAVLNKALAKDPNDRYQQGSDLALALQEVFGPVAAEPAAASTAEPPALEDATLQVTRQMTPPPPSTGEAARQMTPPPPSVTPPPPSAPEGAPVFEPPSVTEPTLVTGIDLTIPPAPVRRSPSKFPRQLLIAGGVAAAIAVVVGGFLLLGGGGGSSQPPGSTASATRVGTVNPAPALMAEGDSLAQQGKLEEAVAKYQEALLSDPNSDIGRTQLGIAYYLLPELDELAQDELEKALEANPTNVRALAFLCVVRSDLAQSQYSKDFSLAEHVCNRALELDPQNAQAHAFLGEVYAAQDRNDEGLAEATRGLELAPNDYYVLTSLGYVRALRGEWSEAASNYRAAIELQPNFGFMHLLLAEALRETQQYDEALASARKALDVQQGYDARAHTNMGHTLWDKGDTDAAIGEFSQAVNLDEADDYAHWGWGAVLYDVKADYQGALPHLERAAALAPNNAGYQAWLGACYMAVERYPEARTALERSLQLDPEREDARSLLDDLTAMGY